jgi:transcriptional regulator with XRE-family HTH domain
MVLMTKPRKRPSYVALGSRLRMLREKAGISQRELARRAHISEGYPTQLEKGTSRPEPDVLRSISDVLNGDYEELAALAGYVSRPPEGRPLMVPSNKWDVMRDMLRHSSDAIREAEIWLRIRSTYGIPPEQAKNEPNGEASRPSEPEDPEADSQSPT